MYTRMEARRYVGTGCYILWNRARAQAKVMTVWFVQDSYLACVATFPFPKQPLFELPVALIVMSSGVLFSCNLSDGRHTRLFRSDFRHPIANNLPHGLPCCQLPAALKPLVYVWWILFNPESGIYSSDRIIASHRITDLLIRPAPTVLYCMCVFATKKVVDRWRLQTWTARAKTSGRESVRYFFGLFTLF
jgi:hypothetical protein